MNFNRLIALSALLAAPALVGCAFDTESDAEFATSAPGKPKRFAPDQMSSESENYALWSNYCVGDKAVTQKPVPNYENDEVMEAATKLSAVATHSFALYGDINGFHKSDLPAELEGKVSREANQFLTYLCGEFRDRATMVQAKINWVRRMNYLEDVAAEHDPSGDPWQQMVVADYKPYLALSEAVFDAKREKLEAEGRRYMTVGTLENIDTPVDGFTVCETKYMFAEYVRKGQDFHAPEGLQPGTTPMEHYEKGYSTFRDAHCTLPTDEEYYYDFRGDSNIKPNSPESNGMIWMARTIARQCDSRSSAAPYQQARPESNLPADFCKAYFKYPFTYRWNAARAGLASWILVDPTQGGLDSNSSFQIVPRFVSDPNYVLGDRGPYQGFANGTQLTPLAGWESYWRFGGMGLADMLSFSKENIHKAIQLAVDRHTDWYDSSYDDKMPWKAFARNQAYSPFVASSYEMSESDNFTSPGVTVEAIDPTAAEYKHFMFVFKIHRDNWFTPETIVASDKPIPNFDRQWFDETSFGETGLANSEKAWDRLGTALESELDSILYLRNVPRY
jgi:hypothetical protein